MDRNDYLQCNPVEVYNDMKATNTLHWLDSLVHDGYITPTQAEEIRKLEVALNDTNGT